MSETSDIAVIANNNSETGSLPMLIPIMNKEDNTTGPSDNSTINQMSLVLLIIFLF
jgi:hypothetical protein